MEELIEDIHKVREQLIRVLGHEEGIDPNDIYGKLEDLVAEESSVRVGKVVHSICSKLESRAMVKSDAKAKNVLELIRPDESMIVGEGMLSLTGSQGGGKADSDNKSAAANNVRELAASLVAVFPDTPPDYILARCQDIVGNTAEILGFSEELLESPHPPDDWKLFYKPVKILQDKAPTGLKLQDGQSGGDVDVDKLPLAGPSSRLNQADVDHEPSDKVRHNERKSKEDHLGGYDDIPPHLAGPSTSKNGPDIDPLIDWEIERQKQLMSMLPDLCPDWLLKEIQSISRIESRAKVGSDWLTWVAQMEIMFETKVDELFSLSSLEKDNVPSRVQWEAKRQQAEMEQWSSKRSKCSQKESNGTCMKTVPYKHPQFGTQAVLNSQFFPVEKKVFTPAELRTIKDDDPTFRKAWDAQHYFYSMQHPTGKKNKIKSVTVVTNRKLANAFEAKKKFFVDNNIPANPIYAYHGTKSDPTILDNILENNFDLKYAKRQAHGAGHYFSEFPDVSLGYGPGLIFCQLLSGKEYKGTNYTWPGFDSKVVQPRPGTGHSQMVIITDSAQILPLCLIHLQ